uniref:Uncharacterized protein n=1 Tax=Romanomermis culicivorax TaxID=13658 RepID=A0A915I4I4_ROMCU
MVEIQGRLDGWGRATVDFWPSNNGLMVHRRKADGFSWFMSVIQSYGKDCTFRSFRNRYQSIILHDKCKRRWDEGVKADSYFVRHPASGMASEKSLFLDFSSGKSSGNPVPDDNFYCATKTLPKQQLQTLKALPRAATKIRKIYSYLPGGTSRLDAAPLFSMNRTTGAARFLTARFPPLTKQSYVEKKD